MKVEKIYAEEVQVGDKIITDDEFRNLKNEEDLEGEEVTEVTKGLIIIEDNLVLDYNYFDKIGYLKIIE